MTTITVPCVAAHLLVTPQPHGAAETLHLRRHITDGWWHDDCPFCRLRRSKGGTGVPERTMVLRFMPTDATTECETCGGRGTINHDYWSQDCDDCPDCPEKPGRRALRAGDRIAIRAGDLPDDMKVGAYEIKHGWSRGSVTRAPHFLHDGLILPVRPGEVVGHATVADVLQITGRFPPQDSWRDPWRIITAEPWPIVTSWPGYGSAHPEVALFDHLAAGLVFTPGQVALELTDVEAA